ncbi:molybdopterin cofactor-binding domain-containing protein [Streptomyces sp. CA-249302]|uniref:molybdopterin cofactor-binding domain-containing protein n=1 Tax=Streptomyces sp. CA-249302 TaxID=3240058 RepID=UPI003D8B5535
MIRDGRWSRAARGAHFCEVHADADTGEVPVARMVGAFDVGRVINPKTAASQLHGAVVMGVGMALSGQVLVDPRDGTTMSAGLDSYYVPVHVGIPQIDVTWVGEPDPTMPLGLMGLGEVGTAGVAAAVANAVFHATGRRIRDRPITLDKLIEAWPVSAAGADSPRSGQRRRPPRWSAIRSTVRVMCAVSWGRTQNRTRSTPAAA